MAKPVILAVDDDREVLQAVARDLRSKYGEQYRILRANSGEEAIEALRELRVADEPVALLLVDQRMPGITGVQFLEQAIEHYPKARRVLLTAYADTEAAIRAINEVHIDYYLLKPWDPPETQLYPVLDDLLDDWMATYRPPTSGVRLIGHRWSSDTHRARDFLARNQVPYRWSDLDSDPEADELLRATGLQQPALPVLILTDGTTLEAPSNDTIASNLGMQNPPELPLYDLVVIGAGPAGLAAAVYGASEGLGTVLIEADVTVRCETQVERAMGSERLEGLELRNSRTGELTTTPATTLFVFVGATPRTDWLGSSVLRDQHGFVLTGRDLMTDNKPPPGWLLDRPPLLLETSAPGVFAAGDVRYGSGKRVAAAVGEGSMSVMLVWEYRASLGL